MRLRIGFLFLANALAARLPLVLWDGSDAAPRIASMSSDAQMPQQTYDPTSSDILSGEDIALNLPDPGTGGPVNNVVPSSAPIWSVPDVAVRPPPVQVLPPPRPSPPPPRAPPAFTITPPDVIPDILKPEFMPPPMPAFDPSATQASLQESQPALNAPPATVPVAALPPSSRKNGGQEMQELTAEFFPNSRRVKVRYGPFKADGWDSKKLVRVLERNQGISDFVKLSLSPPCKECVLIYAAPGLEFADGTDANTHNGVWLYGMMMTNNIRSDAVCPLMRERFFGSGNERSIIMFNNVNNPSVRSGYHVGSKDTFGLQLEVLNINVLEKEVYLTVTWEFIKNRPAGWRKTRAIYLDIGKCGITPGQEAPNAMSFSFTAGPWRSSIGGTLISAGSHISEGGTNILITKNSAELCNSTSTYGTVSQFRGLFPASVTSGDHLAFMKFCWLTERLERGDTIASVASYDITGHPPLRNAKGKMFRASGISVVYVAED